MWQYTNSDELYHYGILGMKWGIRRYQNKDGTRTLLGKKRERLDSNEHKETRSILKKKVSEMSNSELKKVNERLQLEENYKRLKPNAIKKYLAATGILAATVGSINTLKTLGTTGGKLVEAGKNFYQMYGNKTVRNLIGK